MTKYATFFHLGISDSYNSGICFKFGKLSKSKIFLSKIMVQKYLSRKNRGH